MAWNEPFDRPSRADLTGGVGLAPRYLNWCSINDPERIALGIGRSANLGFRGADVGQAITVAHPVWEYT
jgi:hypothetical protein